MRAMKKTLIPVLIVTLLMCVLVPFGYRAHIIGQMQQSLRHPLYDPDSAQFRNLRLRSGWTANGALLCGEMNARNRLGGYSGFEKFAATSPWSHFINNDEVVSGACDHLDDPVPWWYLGRGG